MNAKNNIPGTLWIKSHTDWQTFLKNVKQSPKLSANHLTMIIQIVVLGKTFYLWPIIQNELLSWKSHQQNSRHFSYSVKNHL